MHTCIFIGIIRLDEQKPTPSAPKIQNLKKLELVPSWLQRHILNTMLSKIDDGKLTHGFNFVSHLFRTKI